MFSIVYITTGNIEEARKCGMIVKTKTERIKDIEERVKQLHSYELPCVISLGIGESSPEYLKWIGESVD